MFWSDIIGANPIVVSLWLENVKREPPTGFDPATSCLPSTRSTRLSYDGRAIVMFSTVYNFFKTEITRHCETPKMETEYETPLYLTYCSSKTVIVPRFCFPFSLTSHKLVGFARACCLVLMQPSHDRCLSTSTNNTLALFSVFVQSGYSIDLFLLTYLITLAFPPLWEGRPRKNSIIGI